MASKSKVPTNIEYPNTLRSTQYIRIVDLIGEGPLRLKDGLKGVYFGETPVQNQDGSFNFNLRAFDFRPGLPEQDPMPGFPSAETTVNVETEVRFAMGGVVRTITAAEADVVRIILRVPALTVTDPNGNTFGGAIGPIISARSQGKPFEVKNVDVIAGKNTSPYRKQVDIRLSDLGPAPWDIRVQRSGPESQQLVIQDQLWWESYSIIEEGKYSYPDCAIAGLDIDAQTFGQNLEARSYKVSGTEIPIPTNYDPVARTYSGSWDGTFKIAATSNPVWHFLNLLRNDLYGLGEFINPATADKWGLYTIAQYCDQEIPSGFKGVDGQILTEPRFSYVGAINNRQAAHKVLEMVSSAFRGMAYWSLGQVYASADMPQDPIADGGLIGPANVIKGHFKYSGTAAKARHSVAYVKWNDPRDFYRPATEVVQDDEAMAEFGFRETEVQAHGCVSRGQAHRFGKWILDTERNETELVEFSCSWEQAKLQPGNIILIADPRKSGGHRTAGRSKALSNSTITFDAPFTPDVSAPVYTLYTVDPDGRVQQNTVDHFVDPDGKGGFNGAVLATNFAQKPATGTMWVLSGADARPRRFRVMSVSEEKRNEFRVVALFNDPTKYARVEQNINLDPIQYARPRRTIQGVTNLDVRENNYLIDGQPRSRISISWSAGLDFLSSSYFVSAESPQGLIEYGQVQSPQFDIEAPTPGPWKIHVVSADKTGTIFGPPVSADIVVSGWDGVAVANVVSLAIQGGGQTFGGRAPTVTWQNVFAEGAVAYECENVVRVYDADTNFLLRKEIVKGDQSYTYSYEKNQNDRADGKARRRVRISVTARGITGSISELESTAASIVVSNPVPSVLSFTPYDTPLSLNLRVTIPADADFSGVIVWASKDAGFTPNDATKVYDGPNTDLQIVVGQGLWYYRVAGYDAFGKDGLNVSAEFSQTVNLVRAVDLAAEAIKAYHLAEDFRLEIEQLDASVGDALIPKFTSVPTAFSGDTIRVGTPAKFYSWVDGAYQAVISETSAESIIGQIPYEKLEAITLAMLGGTITDEQIGQLPAGKLSGTIPDATLALISMGKLAGKITATQVDPGFIQTPMLGAGVVTADKVGANEISAGKLNLSDPTNIILNGTFWDTIKNAPTSEAWTLESGTYLEDLSGSNDPGGKGRIACTNPNVYVCATNRWFACNPGDVFYASCAAYNGRPAGPGAIFMVLTWQDATGAVIGNHFLTSLGRGWSTVSGRFPAAPANTARAILQLGADTDTSGVIHFGRVELRRASNTLMIVQGAIVAEHLQAESVTSQAIAADAVRARNIKSDEIYGRHIVAGEITAGKMTLADASNMLLNGTLTHPITNAAFGEGWNYGGSTTIDTAAPNDIGGLHRFVNADYANAYNIATSHWMACGPGDVFTGKCMYYSARPTGGTAIFYEFVDAANSQLSTGFIGPSDGGPQQKHIWDTIEGKTGAAPAAATKFRISLVADPSSSGSVYFGKIWVRRAMSTLLIVDGAIKTRHIQTNSLKGDVIEAGTMSTTKLYADWLTVTGRIDANVIEANMLKAGIVTADKLGVGIDRNILFNSDLLGGNDIAPSVSTNNPARPFTFNVVNEGSWPEYTPRGLMSGLIFNPGDLGNDYVDYYALRPNRDGTWNNRLPCAAGDRYQFSAYISSHWCIGTLSLAFYNENNVYITETELNSATAVSWAGQGTNGNFHQMKSLGPNTRIGGFATAPAGAVMMMFIVRKRGTANGNQSHLFFTGMMLARATSSQTALSTWEPANGTIVDGATVRTGSLHASRIVAYSIDATLLAADSVTANAIKAGTIKGVHIETGTLEAKHINVTELSALSAEIGNLTVTRGGITFPAGSSGFIEFWDNT